MPYQRLSQSILDTLTAHVAVIDPAGVIVAVNKAWTAFAKSNGNPSPAGVEVGANYLEVARHATGPYSREGQAASAGIQAVLDGSLPLFSLEYTCHSPARQRWFLLNVSPLDETPIQAVLSHFDITPLKLTEDKLRASEEQLRELASHLHQILWVIDVKEAKVLYVSPAYETIWGRSCQSLLDNPRSYLDGFHPDDMELMVRANAAMYETGYIDVKSRVQRPDGSVSWVWTRGYPVLDEGKLVRLVGVVEDVTQQKEAEDETATLAAIIEYADDAIISITLQGIVITWNEGAERLYGYTAEEMVGHSILILHPPEKHDEYHSIIARTKKGERVAAFDTERIRKDGKAVAVSLSASAIEVQPGLVTGASKISHDITKFKLLESQFRQAQKMEAVGLLAGGVAHDFNNLLTVIGGYSELLIGQLGLDDPMRESMVEIHQAGERAGNLTRQLLAFSRQQVLEPKVLNLNVVIADTEKMLRRLIGEDVILTTVLDPVLAPIKVDPGQIQQVLMNLSVNARDAMPRGGRITIETRQVTLDATYHQTHGETKPGQYSMMSVSDTGAGMNDETMARIFDPFFTTKESGKGTGLGMAVVHGVVKQSGGQIEVYSELGKGTVFKIYFPIAKGAHSPAPESLGSRQMPSGNATLLLVEDEDSVRALSRNILQSCGYEVLEASDGREAVRIAHEHEGAIHLVVTDVVMPYLGGRQLAERLELIRPGLKILFLSGYTDDAVVRHGILEADVAFLQKPFTPNALAQKVRAVLDQSD